MGYLPSLTIGVAFQFIEVATNRHIFIPQYGTIVLDSSKCSQIESEPIPIFSLIFGTEIKRYLSPASS